MQKTKAGQTWIDLLPSPSSIRFSLPLPVLGENLSAVTFSVTAPNDSASLSYNILLDAQLLQGKFFQHTPLTGVCLKSSQTLGGVATDGANINWPADIGTVYDQLYDRDITYLSMTGSTQIPGIGALQWFGRVTKRLLGE